MNFINLTSNGSNLTSESSVSTRHEYLHMIYVKSDEVKLGNPQKRCCELEVLLSAGCGFHLLISLWTNTSLGEYQGDGSGNMLRRIVSIAVCFELFCLGGETYQQWLLRL
ncbi:hypothetical protein EWB00_007166 [Schistosoma japonicum]|uniref:Uncharacterized protein n=1 Tax=Schistosoma japonicum TaxID=6182 RepID=A0A4Z2CVY8_SCHJA|nr:hypothetical protein EWB00_007166 [Schistosoma japonicum]